MKNLNAIHPPATEHARFSGLILATKQPSAPRQQQPFSKASWLIPAQSLMRSCMRPSCTEYTTIHYYLSRPAMQSFTMGDSTSTNVLLALTFPEAPVSRNPAQMPAGLQAADPSSPATSHRPCGTQSDALVNVIGKSLLPWAASPAELATCDTMLHLAALGKRSENLGGHRSRHNAELGAKIPTLIKLLSFCGRTQRRRCEVSDGDSCGLAKEMGWSCAMRAEDPEIVNGMSQILRTKRVVTNLAAAHN